MTLKSAQIPLPLARSWPVGLRLRFKLDAAVKPYCRYLRGTPVLVLSGPGSGSEPALRPLQVLKP